MAFSRVLQTATGKSLIDMSSRQYHIVELTANPFEVTAASAGVGVGVLQNHPAAGEAATIALAGSETRVRAGSGGVGVGQFFTSAASGWAVGITSGALPTRSLGRALTAAASGSVFTGFLEQTVTVSGAAN